MAKAGWCKSGDIKPRAVLPEHLGLDVENAFAGVLAVGTLVYVSGVNTTSGVSQVSKASATGLAPSNIATYVVLEAIPQSGYGKVTRAATLINVDTSLYALAGDVVYLSSTAGASTPTDPSIGGSAVRQRVGYVKVKSATVGEIVYDLVSNTVTKVSVTMLPVTTVQYATLSITNAQMLAIASTPITLVAAQGAGTVVELLSGELFFDYTAAYAEPSAPDDLVVRYIDGTGTIVSQDVDATGFLTATGDAVCRVAPLSGAIQVGILKAACDNQALVLHNTGNNYTGGNVANIVRARIAYRVHSAGW